MVVRMKRPGVPYIALTIVLFSAFEVVSRLIGPRMEALQVSLWRFAAGGLLLLALAAPRLARYPRKELPALLGSAALMGFLNVVVSMGLIQYALVFTPASVTALVFSSNPVYVSLLAVPLLGERMGWRRIAALALGMAGVALGFAEKLLGPAASGAGGAASAAAGAGLVLASAVVFALYTVTGKRIMKRTGADSLTLTALSFVIGSAMLVPLMLALRVPLLPRDPSIIPHMAVMSLLITGVAYASYFKGLSLMDAGAGSVLYFAKPPLAALFAFLALGERPSLGLAGGFVLIAAGIAVNFAGTGIRRAGRDPAEGGEEGTRESAPRA